ncbi:MAG TPA: efflux RND transporter periplasmic adaptor subunit, partial [Levilinea sp.]|nr:efflux RND transporter periplasmic adaptor subunit [Levilinea sp.]
LNTMDQFFTVPGQVAEVMVEDGDTVTVGQALARLENSPDAQTAKVRAKQELLAAQQSLDGLQTGTTVRLAQARLDVMRAEKAVEEAQTNFDADPSDDSQVLLDQASAVLELAQETFHILETSGGVDPDLLAAANARLVSANAALAGAEAALDSLVLKASAAGTIVDLNLQAGQWVSAGAPVISIADFSGWVVKTNNLTEAEVVKVSLGQTVNITLDALPGKTVRGEVIHINARFEEKRGEITYTVTTSFNQADPLQRWGMTAAVQFLP